MISRLFLFSNACMLGSEEAKGGNTSTRGRTGIFRMPTWVGIAMAEYRTVAR